MFSQLSSSANFTIKSKGALLLNSGNHRHQGGMVEMIE
jgi:hypothetical protein